jgi:uncharacterized protein (DUF58 family)
VFALMIGGMLIGSINYSLNMGYVLAFWLMGLGIVAMLHTWHNLAHLHISASKAPPVFAGEEAHFSFILNENSGRERTAIGLKTALKTSAQTTAYCNVSAHGSTEVVLGTASKLRGWLQLGKVNVFTRFPLGLFHTWGYVESGLRCLIYPHPASPGLPIPAAIQQFHTQGSQTTHGDEDFSGLRNYRLGDSMRRVDWKASAREQGLYTKDFEGQGQFSPWLDWEITPGKDTEHKLSQLTRWTLDAHAAGLAFGLRLPGYTLPPAADEAHFREALKALALF